MRRQDIREIDIADIYVGDRHRSVDQKRVAELAASIDSIGLQVPIFVADYEGEAEAYWQLIAGAHRLAAFKELGRKKIEAFVIVDADAIDREILEIVENVHRVDLSKDERDRQLLRLAELIEAREDRERKLGFAQNQQNPKGGRPVKLASKVAKVAGVSRNIAARAIGQTKPKKTKADKTDLDMKAEAAKLARKFTIGQLQELIDHLTDNIKARMAA